jgi:hypothetical protein
MGPGLRRDDGINPTASKQKYAPIPSPFLLNAKSVIPEKAGTHPSA